jgi:hypothetical protein
MALSDEPRDYRIPFRWSRNQQVSALNVKEDR